MVELFLINYVEEWFFHIVRFDSIEIKNRYVNGVLNFVSQRYKINAEILLK